MAQTEGNDWEETDISALISGIKGDGVVSGIAVSESSPAAMSVYVSSGSCEINDVVYTEVAGQNLNIANGDSTHPRKDLIVYDATAGNPAVVEGNPASAPHPPTIPSGDIYLAMIHIAANESTSVVNADIDEGRVFSNVKLQGIPSDADKTSDNTPQDHAGLHNTDGGDEITYYDHDIDGTIITDSTGGSATGTVYVKVWEKTLTKAASHLKISYIVYGSTTFYSKLYKNGTPIGAEHTGSASTTVTATFTDFVVGDKIQMYLHSSGSYTAYLTSVSILGKMVTLPEEPGWT